MRHSLLIILLLAGHALADEPVYDGRPLSAWLEQLKSPEVTQRRAAAAFLSRRISIEAKDAAIPLAIAMKDTDRRVRLDVVKAVTRQGTPGINAVVGRLLEDIDRDKHRVAVFRALGDLGSPARAAGPNVLTVMKANEKNKVLQVVGARTVIALDSRSARTLLTVLVNGLKDGDSEVRKYAAEGLGELGGIAANKATQTLIETLKDSDLDVRLSAASSLAKVERREAGRSATTLVEIIRTETGVIRTAAIEALAELGPAARLAVEQLRLRLKDSDANTRLSAAVALYAVDSKTASTDAVPVLIAGLKDDSPEIRLAASEALKQIGPEAKSAVPALLADLKTPGGNYAKYAATLDTVSRIGEPAVPALVDLLQQAPIDPALARAIVECLGKIGPPAKGAGPALIEMLRDHRNVLLHRFVVITLGRIGPEVLPKLKALLTDPDVRLQILAIQSIGEMGTDAKSMASELRKLKTANSPANVIAAIDATLKRIDPLNS